MKYSTLLEIQGILVTANRSDLAKELVVVGKEKKQIQQSNSYKKIYKV